MLVGGDRGHGYPQGVWLFGTTRKLWLSTGTRGPWGQTEFQVCWGLAGSVGAWLGQTEILDIMKLGRTPWSSGRIGNGSQRREHRQSHSSRRAPRNDSRP